MLVPGLDRPGVAAGISALTLALAAIIGLLTLRDRFNWLGFPVALLLGLLVWDVLFMVFSKRSFTVGDYTSALTGVALFVGLAAAARQKRWRRTIWAAITLCIVVGSAICIWEFFRSPNFFSTAPGRAAGIYQNPNLASEIFSGGLLFFLGSMNARSSLWQRAVLMLVILGILTTVSRTGIIVTGVMLAYWIWFTYGRKHLISFTLISVSSSTLLIALLLYANRSLDLSNDASIRVESLLSGFGVNDFSQERGGAAEISLLMLRENLWGYGTGTVPSMPLGPHNMYLGIAVDHGVLIAGAYLFLWLWLGWRAFLNRDGNIVPRLFWFWLGVWNVASHNMFAPASLAIMAIGLAGAVPLTRKPQMGAAHEVGWPGPIRRPRPRPWKAMPTDRHEQHL